MDCCSVCSICHSLRSEYMSLHSLKVKWDGRIVVLTRNCIHTSLLAALSTL